MSCYSDGDLLTYRAGKRILSATVRGDQETTDRVLVQMHKGPSDCVPVETIVMHQPQLLAS
jgi:hypothetical protein